jgi:hypothetical protein
MSVAAVLFVFWLSVMALGSPYLAMKIRGE